MDRSANFQCSPQPAVRVSEDFRTRAVQFDRYAASKGLDIYHAILSPNEYETAYTHHVLALQINTLAPHDSHQVIRFAGQEYDGLFPSGASFLVPARTTTFLAWNQTDESIIFTIEPAALQQIAIETECLNPTKVELKPIAYNQDPQLKLFARLFREEMQNNAIGGQLYSESLANLFLIHLLRHYCTLEANFKQNQGGLSRDRLRIAIDYIQTHLDEKLTLEAISRQLNISQYHFCDLFKQSMGMPPYEYVLQQRIERAKDLLRKHREMAIIEIALQCGFANQTHFHKHFRKFMGMTPKAYRG